MRQNRFSNSKSKEVQIVNWNTVLIITDLFFIPLKAKLLLDFDIILWESFTYENLESDARDNVGLKLFLLK
jgi:hypothetical protein